MGAAEGKVSGLCVVSEKAKKLICGRKGRTTGQGKWKSIWGWEWGRVGKEKGQIAISHIGGKQARGGIWCLGRGN